MTLLRCDARYVTLPYLSPLSRRHLVITPISKRYLVITPMERRDRATAALASLRVCVYDIYVATSLQSRPNPCPCPDLDPDPNLTLTKARGAAGRRGGGEIRCGRRPFRASAGYTYRGHTYYGHTHYGHTYYGYTYYSDIDFGYTYYGHTDLVPFNTPPPHPILPLLRPPSSRLSIPYPPLHYAIRVTALCRCAASWRPRCTRRAPAPPPTSWRHGGFEP